MKRDSKGRFCKEEKKEAIKNKSNSPFFVRIVAIPKKYENRFDKKEFVNNDAILHSLNRDELAEFIGVLITEGHSPTCILYDTPDFKKDFFHCFTKVCSDCFKDWLFNHYTPEIFNDILRKD